MTASSQPKLSEACSAYLETQVKEDRKPIQQELFRFVRWCGWDRPTDSIAPTEIEKYCTTLDGMGDGRIDRLNITKKFLTYLFKKELTPSNLASHAKVRRTGRRSTAQHIQEQPTSNRLTAEGYKRLQDELESLKAQRGYVVEEIRLAAVTKDVTENAPLDAAREQQSQHEARIRDLEVILKSAAVIGESDGARRNAVSRVEIGSRIVLRQDQTGKKVSYMLVHSSEADPASGKISDVSPLGKAVLDKMVGDEVEVAAPRGTVSYRVAKIG